MRGEAMSIIWLYDFIDFPFCEDLISQKIAKIHKNSKKFTKIAKKFTKIAKNSQKKQKFTTTKIPLGWFPYIKKVSKNTCTNCKIHKKNQGCYAIISLKGHWFYYARKICFSLNSIKLS